MPTVPVTPGRSTTTRPSAALATTTPTTTRLTSAAATTAALQASPHYATTRRHSLYGVEDRVVIDAGARIWKVGFSGEGRPRDVFYVGGAGSGTAGGGAGDGALWRLGRPAGAAERAEEDRLLAVRLESSLRYVFHYSLLTAPASRKVIILEHPLFPLYVKEIIARVLFENLQVPSISFASSHLLSLLAVGRITGLVLDCGHLESIALPIFAARPLFPLLHTTPLAGGRLTSHLRALLLLFGTFLPPPTTLSGAAPPVPSASRATRVPEEVLTDSVIEAVKTRCCFVGDILESAQEAGVFSSGPSAGDDSAELDAPPSDVARSESEFSHLSAGRESSAMSQSSDFSIVAAVAPATGPPAGTHRAEGQLQALARMYARHSTATDLHMRVDPPASQNTGTGKGTLIIPGWVRDRAAEVLFEGGDIDESSVAEVILDTLLKVPVDLRKTLASSILVVGGTAMLPGFIPRLHAEILRALSASSPPSDSSPLSSPSRSPARLGRHRRTPYARYAPLLPLTSHFAILNNPSPPAPVSSRTGANSGKAPAFTPAVMAWVGGSLAGSLKTGGVEISREKWDTAHAPAETDGDEEIQLISAQAEPGTQLVLPDWTRPPLGPGAPNAAMQRAGVGTAAEARVVDAAAA